MSDLHGVTASGERRQVGLSKGPFRAARGRRFPARVAAGSGAADV